MPRLTRHQVRRVDQLAVEELKIPSIVLMENASRNVAQAVLEVLRERKIEPRKARIAVVCGGGNNGGDGYAVARHLHNAGCGVVVYYVKEPGALEGDARTNYVIVERMGLSLVALVDGGFREAASGWEGAQVIVDAMLGTGFTGSVRAPVDSVIRRIKEARKNGATVVAVDIPSGLDCDTGQPGAEGAAVVEADITVTFVAEKIGCANPAARSCLGRVIVADIGAPPSLIERVVSER